MLNASEAGKIRGSFVGKLEDGQVGETGESCGQGDHMNESMEVGKSHSMFAVCVTKPTWLIWNVLEKGQSEAAWMDDPKTRGTINGF